MSTSHWSKVQALFEAALALDPDARSAYLDQVCMGDEALVKEVAGLLAADADGDGLWGQLAGALPEAPEAPLKPGQLLGPYHIVQEIGFGGMGVVYAALDTRLDRDVALKCLPAHLSKHPESRQRFMAEAKAASQLDHPNICVLFDIGEMPDGSLYLTMPYYRGESLADHMESAPLSLETVLGIARQVGSGLAAAHEKGIVHRDIKPANLMLTTDGRVKIVDFGIAKMTGIELTRTGGSVGTVAYMAPEQIRGEQVDHRTDLWALGVVMYEALSGQRPFAGTLPHEIMMAVLSGTAEPVSRICPDLGDSIDPLLSKLLAHDPDQRYPNAETLLQDLDSVLGRCAGRRGSDADTAAHMAQGQDWNPAVLEQIARELTESIGPIAPILVRQAAQSCTCETELRDCLAARLQDPSARRTFLRSAGIDNPTSSRGIDSETRASANRTTALPPETIDAIETALAQVLGPIAHTLVLRTGARCTSTEALCRALTEHMEHETDRDAFMSTVRRLW